MTLRAVFFDAGNTLLELDYQVLAERIRDHGHPVTPDLVRQAEQRARVRLDPHLAQSRSTEAEDVFKLYFGFLLENLGVAWDGAADRIVEDLRTARPYGLWTVAVPEAGTVLEALRGRGLRLAVVSNSNGTAADLLEAAGLAAQLDVIVDSAIVGVEKPDPRIFHHAAAALGVRPEEAVHVGDLYSVDVLGARAAGCRAILLDPAGAWPVSDCPKALDLRAAARLIEGLDPPRAGATTTAAP